MWPSLRPCLPKSVQQAVVGTINADVTATPAEVGEKSLALIREVAAERKARLVDQLITTAAKGGPAALGLANTLGPVLAGGAYHLVLDDEFSASAVRCDNCGYVGVRGTHLGRLPAVWDDLTGAARCGRQPGALGH